MKKYNSRTLIYILSLFFVTLVTALVNGVQPVLIKKIIDSINKSSDPINLLFGGYLLSIVVVLFSEYITKIIYANYNKYLSNLFRTKITNRILNMPTTKFQQLDPEEYISLYNNEVPDIVSDAYMLLPKLIFQMLSIIIYSYILWSINYVMAIVVILSNLLILFVPKLFKVHLQKYKEKSFMGLRKYNLAINDLVRGFHTIKNYCIQERIAKNTEKVSNEQLLNNYKYQKLNAYSNISVGAILFLTSFFTLFWGANQIQNNLLTLGGLIAVIQISDLIISPIIGFTSDLSVYNSTINLRNNILKNYLIFDPENKENNSIKQDRISFINKIDFKNITFSYNNTPLLNNFTTSFEKGGKYLILGPNGSGKSTLIKLLLKDLDCYEGDIYINDIKVNDINYLNTIGYASQVPYLFNGTIKENILLSQDYDEEWFSQVIEVVCLDKDFINSRIDMMNDTNNSISGGEKQKICIARLLYSKPSVIIFDEATSQIDQKTSYQIEQFMLNDKELIFINIAHKLHDELLSKYNHTIKISK